MEELINGLRSLGLSEDLAGPLVDYKDLLLEWNERVNLTAITDEREVYIKHFLDSLSCGVGILKGAERVIDVGTGAGFPGLPLKIAYPNIRLTLLDSLKKRLNFLEEVITKLGLKDIELLHSRAEDGARDKNYRDGFDLVYSRAVASLPVLCELCLPFAKVGGIFVALKSKDYKAELDEAKRAIEVLGGKVSDIKEIELPYDSIKRSLVLISKVKATPKTYPRKAGTPAKNPIL